MARERAVHSTFCVGRVLAHCPDLLHKVPAVELLSQLPELSGLDARLIRIPDQQDVPLTSRVVAILDTPAMQRLKGVSQLGLVRQVYPGATHSRFEHSLGVYRLARLVLTTLCRTDSSFSQALTADDAKTFLLAALLHDVGHWPYCHPIEDLDLAWVPEHESLARRLISSGEVAEVITRDWQVRPKEVADFLTHSCSDKPALRVLQNALDGPVDIDKMDYLQRDSLHAGVPYGRNFDLNRLLGCLCTGHDESSLAISEKGKTAAEMMVFARYVMFSEVYWHHTVRSSTAMLQRLIYEQTRSLPAVRQRELPEQWVRMSDGDFEQHLRSSGPRERPELSVLLAAVGGPQRTLYKRLTQHHFKQDPAVHRALAGRSYADLVVVAERLAERLSQQTAAPLLPTDVLVDAPPAKLEVQFQLQVRTAADQFVALEALSPVVSALATQQFDNLVKRVRVFVTPSRLAELQPLQQQVPDMLLEIAQDLP